VAEIKVQPKKGGSRKWPWLFLLLIPLIWVAMQTGKDDEPDAAASDTTAATAATPASGTPATTTAPADSAGAKKPQP
jgi:hypothetical protein